MSNKDRAEDKLIASIKKTRAGSKAVKKAAVKRAPARKAPAKKVVKKPGTRPKKAAVAKVSPSTRERKQGLVDLFQSGRRVWPD